MQILQPSHGSPYGNYSKAEGEGTKVFRRRKPFAQDQGFNILPCIILHWGKGCDFISQSACKNQYRKGALGLPYPHVLTIRFSFNSCKLYISIRPPSLHLWFLTWPNSQPVNLMNYLYGWRTWGYGADLGSAAKVPALLYMLRKLAALSLVGSACNYYSLTSGKRRFIHAVLQYPGRNYGCVYQMSMFKALVTRLDMKFIDTHVNIHLC